MKNENGYCANCNMDFDGEDILQTFIDQGKGRIHATLIAEDYGYAEGHTRWDKRIGVYCQESDRTTHYRCPTCQHTWRR